MNLRHLSFRLLQVYQAVVLHGSISAAARALHLTQPTVSIQLKKLADWVGEPLLETQEGTLKPTLAGMALYQAAQDVLERFNEFEQQISQARSGAIGTLSLGVVTTAKYMLPKILAGFAKGHPAVDFQLNIGNRAQILDRFDKAQDDLYLFSHPPSGAQVLAQRLLKNPLQLIAPAGHWALQQKDLSFSALLNERFILREPGSATRLMFESWLSGQGLQLNSTLQIESNEVIRASVAAGLGLSVLSAHTLQAGIDPVFALPLRGFPLESHWYLVARRDRRLSYSAREFIRYLSQSLADSVDPAWLVGDTPQLEQFFLTAPQHPSQPV